MNVYVIASEGGMCKIGKANDPQKRVRELSTGSPYRLTVAHTFPLESQFRCFEVERAAHERLAEKRMSGEWFNVTADEAADAVRAEIAKLDQSNSVDRRPAFLDKYQMQSVCAVASDLLAVQGSVMAVLSGGSCTAGDVDKISASLFRSAVSIRDAFEGLDCGDDDEL